MELENLYVALIYTSVFISLLWSLYNAFAIYAVDLKKPSKKEDLLEKLTDEETALSSQETKMDKILDIGSKISKGANTFLYQEYKVMLIFIIFFGAIICVVVDFLGNKKRNFRFYTTGSFIIGSLASILCGFIGMRIAVSANYRTTFKAMTSLEEAFKLSYRAGCVMGFSSVGIGLGLLVTLMLVYIQLFKPVLDVADERSYAVLMEMLAGYGLGGSSMALFGRVGGGIYTKAADVGADLVGKLEAGFEEDSPKNPATIADNVGDNVGDIAGMGSDLFGSFAESTCAALVIIANTPDLIKSEGALYFPLLISAGGIIGCFLTSIFGIFIYKVNTFKKIATSLNLQLLISTVVTLVFIYFSTYSLPDKWIQGDNDEVTSLYCFICAGMGLVSGFLIGMSTDYYTSNAYKPVREVATASSSGSAINIIYGLALGYLSTIIPIFLLSFTVLLSLNLIGMFGVALAAIGMLSTLSVGLAIDAYGPICDNAGGISSMSLLGPEVRKITDALDAAGNTTAAVGKGFAIGSAALVSIALYGAFLTRASHTSQNPIKDLKITNPWIYSMMLIGAMLPYAFSALTMKSVGLAASEMVTEVRRQLKENEGKDVEPDYDSCIAVSTKASIREMILPGMLVMFTPLFFGILFHPILIAGLLPGALLSGVQLAISMSNTGGAWDNTKKYIESGEFVNEQGEVRGKGTEEHMAAVTGDTVGDPLKDTSGPSLNILIKLMAIISLVFAEGFANTSFLAKYLNIEQ